MECSKKTIVSYNEIDELSDYINPETQAVHQAEHRIVQEAIQRMLSLY